MLALSPQPSPAGPDRDRDERKRWRSYNRERLIDFLEFYRDFHEPGYVSPSGTYGDEGLLSYGDQTLEGLPFSPLLVRIYDNPEAWASFRVLRGAVDELRRRRFALYSRLAPAYFHEGCNPDLPAVWASEMVHNNSVGDRLAVNDYHNALDYMLDHVEHYLPKHDRVDPRTGEKSPLYKLRVIVPLRERTGRVMRAKIRRRDALECYHGHRQDVDDAEAVRRAARDTGYSTKEIRKIRRDDEKKRSREQEEETA